MKIKGTLTDRKPLIEALERELGKTAEYCGAPTFIFRVGVYSVLRDGSIEADNPDESLLERLTELGLIQMATPEITAISFPVTALSGRALVNLVFMLASKGDLINKAIGVPDAFSMSETIVKELKENNPANRRDFLKAVYRAGGEAAIKGLKITSDKIIFTGFPMGRANTMEAYRVFAEHLVMTAARIHHAKAKRVYPINEKYTFRVWLNVLGLKGDSYKEARRILLQNSTGNGSFRTQAQYQAHMAKLKNRVPSEPDFVLL